MIFRLSLGLTKFLLRMEYRQREMQQRPCPGQCLPHLLRAILQQLFLLY